MKIIGAILIFLVSIIVSSNYEKRKKQEIVDLKAMVSLLQFIKNQIEYFSLPISEILAKYSTDNECVKRFVDTGYLSFSDKNIQDELIKCFKQLGKGFKEEQISLLNYNIELTNKTIKSNEESNPQKIKVYRAMSLFISSCVVILLA